MEKIVKIKEFIGNEEDNLHCFQCCYRMAVRYLTGREVSLKESEVETNFIEGKQTWPHAGILSLLKQNLEVFVIDGFDYKRFSDNPYNYLKEYINNTEIFNSVLETSNLEKEKELVSKILSNEHCSVETRIPTISDIKNINTPDSIIIANVNYWTLLDKKGYDGHFVIIESVSDEEVILQNPGLPPLPSQVVKLENFLKAWKNDDGADLSNLIIVKRRV